jgi:hypothetical protein
VMTMTMIQLLTSIILGVAVEAVNGPSYFEIT